MSRDSGAAPAAKLGTGLLALLIVLTVGAFAITRAARSGDDLVNTVVLEPRLVPGESARISFALAEGDGAVDVAIIDGNPGSDDAHVRTLAEDVSLAPGTHEYRWRGHDDAGRLVLPGLYALRVVLGEQGRDIRPPGRIRVTAGER